MRIGAPVQTVQGALLLMKSSRFAEFGPPWVLRIEEVPIPEPAEGEALVRAKAAAMNPSDIADVSGRFKNTTLPRTPGRDFAGLVVKGKQYKGEEPEGVRRERCGKQESQYSHSRQSQVAGTAAFTPELLNFLKNTAMMGGLRFIASDRISIGSLQCRLFSLQLRRQLLLTGRFHSKSPGWGS